MSRGYGKYKRGGSSHSSFLFDNLFKENSNKPSAARSAATVGKWGITSFTSIRTVNEKEKEAAAAPKPKKFFKSRNNDPPDLSPSYNAKPDLSYGSIPKKAKVDNITETPPKAASRKFFSSKSASVRDESPPEKSGVLSPSNSSKKVEKPPIVLRICRGKSQLVSDSDESESTPTPSSTPSTSNATSPRTNSQRSPNCRITRSARRSMQQDLSSSPATADTPCEFSLFTSPKQEDDLSPQYIPAEKYELERRAMYDNLLKPNSPSEGGSGLDFEETPPEKEFSPSPPPPREDFNLIEEPRRLGNQLGENVVIPHLQKEPERPPAAAVEPREVMKPHEELPMKSSIEDDWDIDSDSNCSAPDLMKDDPPLGEDSVDNSEKPTLSTEDTADEDPQKHDDDHNDPPVKLVISKKKGSIFKSRSLVNNDGTKKRRALYRHKWSDDKDSGQKPNEGAPANSTNTAVYDEFGFNDDPLTRVVSGNKSEDSDGVTSSIKCTKGDKGYYTVVRNVKKAHQIQEIGEFQEFNDDVEYILDALQDNNPLSTRCLSAITLAGKCMAPAFRMHVRAHGTVAKFFKALHDATKDQGLGLCTATVMFVLSQDRLNMDLDRDCLELMLNLLESDVTYQQALADVSGLSSAQLEKNKQKVRELCAEIQSQGHAMHLNLENITVGQLAMETLLSLTSKRAGEWFKEELRELGGLEHIMKTICECCRQVSDYVVSWTDTLLDKLRKVDRCLRVLENVTHNNEENQTYLLNYNQGVILDTLVNLYKLCDGEIPLYPVTDIADKESTGTIIREALLVTLKVLINLTHHFNKQSTGSSLIGARPGIIETSLHLLLQVPHYIPEQKKFELGVLVLMLLINLIQDNSANKKLLSEAKAPSKLESIYSREESAVEALIAQFYHWEGCAKIAEKRTNAILDGEKDETSTNAPPKSNEEFIEETVAKLLQKAGTHMEYTFLASYIVMLTGFLIMDNMEYQTNVRQFLRGNNFTDMVELLKKFFNFMNLTASTEASSVCAMKATEKVIKFLEECDKPTPEKPSYSECMDLSYTMAH